MLDVTRAPAPPDARRLERVLGELERFMRVLSRATFAVPARPQRAYPRLA